MGAGVVSFAGSPYAAGRMWARQAIDVPIVAASVRVSKDCDRRTSRQVRRTRGSSNV